jgi:hypothetical protein
MLGEEAEADSSDPCHYVFSQKVDIVNFNESSRHLTKFFLDLNFRF